MLSCLANQFSSKKKSLIWLVGWIVVVFLMAGPLGFYKGLKDLEDNSTTASLAPQSESTLAQLKIDAIQGQQAAPVFLVAASQNGEKLTAQQISDLRKLRKRIKQEITSPGPVAPNLAKKKVTPEKLKSSLSYAIPFGMMSVSKSGTSAVSQSLIADDKTGEADSLIHTVEQVRYITSQNPVSGVDVKIGGPAGAAADAISVFQGLDFKLMLGALGLVIVILISIFRSPVFILPIIAVLFAEATARGVAYLAGEAGVLINGQNTSIMSVFVIGAGVDYALLLLFRYREELHIFENHLDALKAAVRETAPAVLASAATVALALLALLLADTKMTSSMGPLGAIGVVCAAISILTVLPAMLALTGRKIFAPRAPRYEPGYDPVDHPGFYGRLGEKIAVKPWRYLLITSAILLALAGFATQLNTRLDGNDTFTKVTESSEAQTMLEKAFPAGQSALTQIVVPASSSADQVVAAVSKVEHVVAVNPAINPRDGKPFANEQGQLIEATLDLNGYTSQAEDVIPQIRTAAKQAGGNDVLVGGETAIYKDLRNDINADTKLVVPVALLLVMLVLIVLLRAVVAPLVLIATVVLSFAAAIGLSVLTWKLLGHPNTSPGQPLYIFIFLVALGVDYNIFLMDRVRREARKHGTKRGMIRGLNATGGVITAAGIVLAGTFAVLGSLPIVFLLQLGVAIGLGVILDTFVVRSILVPAATFILGDRVWKPSKP